MMIIVRVFPNQNLEDSWNRVLQNLGKISNKQCTPLYASQQEEKDFLSIIYDLKDIDAFADILAKGIPSVVNSAKTRTITLLKPVFFPAPKDRPRQLERYQVSLRVASGELHNVFENTIHLDYPNNLFPTYAAYSFGEDDILLSMLSIERDTLRKFVRERIESQKGVLGADIARINVSKRLAPEEIWRSYREDKYLFKPSGGYEEYDFTELAMLTGAFTEELG